MTPVNQTQLLQHIRWVFYKQSDFESDGFIFH